MMAIPNPGIQLKNAEYDLQWTPGVKWRFWSLIHKYDFVPNEHAIHTS